MDNRRCQRLDPESFAEVAKRTPLVSINLVVRNSRSEILVGLRRNDPAKGSWFVPGGRILKDERISDAFEHITFEELGHRLAFEDATFLGVFEHMYADNFTGNGGFSTHFVVLAYEVCLDSSLSELPRTQHSQFKWLTKESVHNEQNIHSYTRAYFDFSP